MMKEQALIKKQEAEQKDKRCIYTDKIIDYVYCEDKNKRKTQESLKGK